MLQRRLAESARRCYPSAAARFRLVGEVGLSFGLDGAGGLTSLSLLGSTGSSILDRAAEECVIQGALPLPVASGARYSVRVRFAPE
ncbi:MAG: TonB family protein [Myxococcaceae bacterium]